MPTEALYEALYTPNLTQKRKKWFDGRCKIGLRSKKARLTDIEGRLLAEQFWKPLTSEELPETGTVIRFERFIVELDSLVRTYDEMPHKVSTPLRTTGPTMTELDRRHHPITRLKPPGLSKEPPLSEILKSDSVRIVAPLNVVVPHTNDSAYTSKKRKKYTPWGFQPSSGAEQTSENEPTEERTFVSSDSEARDFPDSYDELEPVSITMPHIYTLDSDLESEDELEVTDVHKMDSPRKSMFEDIPDVLPSEGPWTKEAYILFSWHPPRPDPDCLIKSEIV